MYKHQYGRSITEKHVVDSGVVDLVKMKYGFRSTSLRINGNKRAFFGCDPFACYFWDSHMQMLRLLDAEFLEPGLEAFRKSDDCSSATREELDGIKYSRQRGAVGRLLSKCSDSLVHQSILTHAALLMKPTSLVLKKILQTKSLRQLNSWVERGIIKSKIFEDLKELACTVQAVKAESSEVVRRRRKEQSTRNVTYSDLGQGSSFLWAPCPSEAHIKLGGDMGVYDESSILRLSAIQQYHNVHNLRIEQVYGDKAFDGLTYDAISATSRKLIANAITSLSVTVVDASKVKRIR